MAKSKEIKSASKAKSEVKPLLKVKNASVTKASQTPNAKSKAIAKETATKVNGKKAPKPVVKAATPSDDDDEDDDEDDEDEEDSDDSADSDEEVEVKKPVANGKTNGVKKQEVDSSDSSGSSDSSDEDSEEFDSDDAPAKPAADDDSEDSDDSEEDSEEEETKPVAVVKNVAKKAVETGKAAVNGAAKAVAKATVEDDDEEDDDDNDEDDDEDDDSSDSSDEEEDDDDDDDDEEAPSKKRKAEEQPVASTKKAKTETAEDTGSKNLFVGNLSWNVDDEWLFREFEEFGEISGARVISDKETGRSKGFGYVEFTDSASAAAALKAKKGALIDGREANVDFSTPRSNDAPRERAQSRAQQFGDQKNDPSDTLFVGNLSFDADENAVGEAFGAHGSVVNVRLPTDQETGNPKGFGYVTFGSVDDAKIAFEAMVGQEIAGRPVRLDYATPRPDRSEGGGRGGGFGHGRGGGRGGFGDRGGRGGGRGGRGGFGDRGGRGGARGGRGGSTNRGGFGDFKGKKQTF